MVKTIQAIARYFPDSCGGIQVHLSELLPALQAQGVECTIAASTYEDREQTYAYGGIKVYRYPAYPKPNREPNSGRLTHQGFKTFERWLSQQSANLYNQHQWEPTCGLPHLKLAKQLGLATVVTLHLPHSICQRGTLMLHNQETCDGKIDLTRCSQCAGFATHLPASAIPGLRYLPLPLSAALWQSAPAISGLLPPLQKTDLLQAASRLMRSAALPSLIGDRQDSLREMTRYADRIIVVCRWLYDMLVANGVPEDKLTICRYGIRDDWHRASEEHPSMQPERIGPERPLRVCFLGRWDAVKGIHILVKAVQSLPRDTAIELSIHGVTQDHSYEQKIRKMIVGDRHIQIEPTIDRDDFPKALPYYDVLAVPSQWLETGPLVALEAHGLGLPVIGSDLGGISELIHHEVDGLLIPAADVLAWARALSRLVAEPGLLTRLSQGIQPPRRSKAEVEDTIAIYRDALDGIF